MNKQLVTLKARDVFQSRDVYERLNRGQINSVTYALYFALNVSELNAQYAEIEAKRVELIKRYGEENDDGMTTVTEENLVEFNEQFIDLMDADMTVSLYLFDPEKLDVMFEGLTGEEVYVLKYMVDYD